ncbi:helix-turn-helix domain-containing protein [Amaricoccus macauensis]|uniref:helix-turn-helix domain-containing protein n=1 Tax=Amaricoccus macauensis TaxID=57001 RepID=UPI003C7B9AFC
MITPPDETYSTAEAAAILSVSERQCGRYLDAGLIRAQRPNGRWRVTALALWRYRGIEGEMMRLWLDYCHEAAAQTLADPTAPEAPDQATQEDDTNPKA